MERREAPDGLESAEGHSVRRPGILSEIATADAMRTESALGDFG